MSVFITAFITENVVNNLRNDKYFPLLVTIDK